ncbi:hypothetical protein Q0812_08400 [Brevundimonas sp. 2R-24]|uniref:Uncharacterized protein n=1 Tax=Peiella sedimenti TaxID=3061083 RepID=A0ABT8SLS8_9CAUL|nr:hypothetical protein [Caulobacteraceae bacterium XZ-24]
MAGQVHFEVFIRKTAASPWALELATEDRQLAMTAADDLLADKRACSVRVCKETLDPETMEFQSVTLVTKGLPEPERKARPRDAAAQQVCSAPQDLYTPHARETIGRVLEDWLARNNATAFELLHRPDLIEKLDASGVELQHAIQKVAIPESQDTGQPIHEVIRSYQALVQKAIDRVIRAGRGGVFPDLKTQGVAAVAHKLAADPERAFRIGGAICAFLAPMRSWPERLEAMMDLADALPAEPQPRALVQVALEQVLCEMFADRRAVASVLGPDLDLGGQLAAMVRLAASAELTQLERIDPNIPTHMPALTGPAARLGARLAAGDYKLLAASLTRRVLRELIGPRRLRPADAWGEIDLLRALAMALTAAAGRLLSLEEVQTAFIERSKTLVTADFVQAYLGDDRNPMEEVAALVRLCDNVTGSGSKRAAGRWLSAAATSLKFEKSVRAGAETPAQRLAGLAALQRSVREAGLLDKDEQDVLAAIGAVGDLVEADARLIAQLARSPAPVQVKLSALLRLAAGEAAPLGPVAERAKVEAVRLLKAPETRGRLAEAPESLQALRGLMQQVGLAA